MNDPRGRAIITAALLSGIALVASNGEATAQEYCIACTGPNATYRCVIEGGTPQAMPLKLLCISRMAKEGGHATCAAKNGTVFDCVGPIRRIDTSAGSDGLSPAPRPAPTEAANPQGAPIDGFSSPGTTPLPPATLPSKSGQGPDTADKPRDDRSVPDPAAPQKKPPQTVERLAKDVGQKSADNLKKAGKAIADTTTKAWRCVTTLFQGC